MVFFAPEGRSGRFGMISHPRPNTSRLCDRLPDDFLHEKHLQFGRSWRVGCALPSLGKLAPIFRPGPFSFQLHFPKSRCVL